MNLIEPSFEILNPLSPVEGMAQLRFIERMARISHRSEDKQTEDSWNRFLSFVVMTKGDWSVVEHAYSTVLFRADRGVTHELVRHRLFSYTQESTRFVNYEKKGGMDFITPVGLGDDSKDFFLAMQDAECSYRAIIALGKAPQVARAVLPNALAATIAVTGNLRNWRHFLIMRTTQETHPDFKRLTIPLLKAFKSRIPLLFDDIQPDQKQSEALSKPK